MQDEVFMRKAIELSMLAVEHGNEPFGAVLVKDNEMVFTNENQIYTRHDPTFHGEAGLIREFCAQTGITDLQEYTMYSSCEPCFMCSGAMVWVKLGRLFYLGNPIYSILAGVYAGKDRKELWIVPVITAVLFLAGAWSIFDKNETVFVLYALIYLLLGIAAMFVSGLKKKS